MSNRLRERKDLKIEDIQAKAIEVLQKKKPRKTPHFEFDDNERLRRVSRLVLDSVQLNLHLCLESCHDNRKLPGRPTLHVLVDEYTGTIMGWQMEINDIACLDNDEESKYKF